MTEEEKKEHAELIHKFGCVDITPAQLKRLEELDEKAILEKQTQNPVPDFNS